MPPLTETDPGPIEPGSERPASRARYDDDGNREVQAPRYPTDADVERLRADLVTDDDSPDRYAIDERIAAGVAERLRAYDEDGTPLVPAPDPGDERAPMFPTDEHVTALAALPGITAAETAAVLAGGPASFAATIDAGRPTIVAAADDDPEVTE